MSKNNASNSEDSASQAPSGPNNEENQEVLTKNFLKAAEGARVKRRKLGILPHSRSQKHLLPETKQQTVPENSAIIVLSDSEDDQPSKKKYPHKATEPINKEDLNIEGGEIPKTPYPRNVVSAGSIDSDNSDSDSDSNSELELTGAFYQTEFPKSHGKGPRSSIRLLCDLSGIDSTGNNMDNNVDTLSLGNLIGSQDLLETYQFNFSVQLPLFLSFLHSNFVKKHRKIVFITGNSVFESSEQKNRVREKFNVSEAVAPLPNRFGSHHTKMMVNIFENGDAEVIIMTCNLTSLDICGLTQALWRSGRLKKGSTSTTSGKRFRFDLLRYLARYGLAVTKNLISVLEKYDFSGVDVELVASAPGLYDAEPRSFSSECYGYAKLRQVLERNGLLIEETDKKHNILSQVTSIAYPYTSQKGQTSSVFSHILCPLMFRNWQRNLAPGSLSFENNQQEFNYAPHIVFPTKNDISQSSLGYLSGAAVHFKFKSSAIHKAQYQQNVEKYLCKWTTAGNVTGREKLTPHVKYYACDNGDNWQSLKWVLVGSHNLSKQAWGYPKPNTQGQKMDVSSYELSVLIPQRKEKLRPSYRADTFDDSADQPVRFPFVLPPVPYGKSDVPWSVE